MGVRARARADDRLSLGAGASGVERIPLVDPETPDVSALKTVWTGNVLNRLLVLESDGQGAVWWLESVRTHLRLHGCDDPQCTSPTLRAELDSVGSIFGATFALTPTHATCRPAPGSSASRAERVADARPVARTRPPD